LCFDVGHARQIDRTMSCAEEILRLWGSRVRQVHVSEVTPDGEHCPVSRSMLWSIEGIAHLVPSMTPVIIESPIKEDRLLTECSIVMQACEHWLREGASRWPLARESMGAWFQST
jgi:hypothetical protein